MFKTIQEMSLCTVRSRKRALVNEENNNTASPNRSFERQTPLITKIANLCEISGFSGFRRGTKTAEAVRDPQPTPFTPLKRDVNERVALIKAKSKSSRVSINLG